MDVNVETVTWEEVKPIWDDHLWPGRDSEPVTSMKYLGGYDLELKKNPPVFFGVKVDGGLVGVNSVVQTGKREYRSRGLWVQKEYRGNRVASAILASTLQMAFSKGADYVWTMPRRNALQVYELCGFIQTTPFVRQDYGDNCYAIRNLRGILEIAKEAERYKQRREEFYWRTLREGWLQNYSSREMRSMMRPLADKEEADWR